jgi:hypothetical protein
MPHQIGKMGNFITVRHNPGNSVILKIMIQTKFPMPHENGKNGEFHNLRPQSWKFCNSENYDSDKMPPYPMKTENGEF